LPLRTVEQTPGGGATRGASRAALARAQHWLGQLPFTSSVTEAGHAFYAVHASPRDHLFRYTLIATASDEHVRKQVSRVHVDYVLLNSPS
jgi:hypothetical protein